MATFFQYLIRHLHPFASICIHLHPKKGLLKSSQSFLCFLLCQVYAFSMFCISQRKRLPHHSPTFTDASASCRSENGALCIHGAEVAQAWEALQMLLRCISRIRIYKILQTVLIRSHVLNPRGNLCGLSIVQPRTYIEHSSHSTSESKVA